MENLLEKYIFSDIPKDLIDGIFNKLTILKNESDTFNSLFKNKKLSLDSKTFEPFYNFLYAYYQIYNCIDTTEFIKELELVSKSSGNEIEFWKSIINFFDKVKFAETETAFLKEMIFPDFKDLISHTFESNVLHTSFYKDYKNWNKEEINVTRKTINTFLYSMIDDFNDFDTTVYILDIKFHFEKEKYEYIWDLCNKNRDFLMIKNITEMLNDLYYRQDSN